MTARRPLRAAPPNVPNPLLREHVTRVGFDLSLGRTHIAALVLIVEHEQRPGYYHSTVRLPRPWTHFVPGATGLKMRGLVEHFATPDPPTKYPFRWHWRTTESGRTVADLLRQSGLYEDYSSALTDWVDDDTPWEGQRKQIVS